MQVLFKKFKGDHDILLVQEESGYTVRISAEGILYPAVKVYENLAEALKDFLAR